MKLKTLSLLTLAIGALSCSSKDEKDTEMAAIPGVIEIDATDSLVAIQPTMYGIFFEDINFGADGGLYAELVKNRSFEFKAPWMGWKHLPKSDTRFSLDNELTIVNNSKITPKNPRVVRVDKRKDDPTFGLQNEGFDGIGIKKDAKYDLSIDAKAFEGNIKIKAVLVDTTGKELGSVELNPSEKSWKTYEGVITATATEEHAKLNVLFIGLGQIEIDNISLFPQDTWKGRKGGMRKDLVQLLADMKPGFVRFPGGCIVEGRTLDERYQWKKTVGNVKEREVLVNRWNTEFAHRPTPDYFQTFGLGFFEYFQLSEDLGAEPLPVLSCGLACQFNTSETVPMEDLDPYIGDALDLIEFANGSTNTKWGGLRASMGHPEPFNLKYIGIGNEQWGQEYFERYEAFAKAIKAKYPNINIVSGTGPSAEGELFESAEKVLAELKPELVDEHYYKPPSWFRENASRYDNYDRNRYKIFAGEYAAQSVETASPENKNSWECALSEAAFMTGLERNADVVYLTSYAPLFAHVNRWQWTPDMIWFNNLTSFGTANYHVQKLYSLNSGDYTVKIKRNGENMTGQGGLYGTACVDKKTNELVIKLVNTLPDAQKLGVNIKGISGRKNAKMINLSSKNPEMYNTIDKPDLIVPSSMPLAVVDGKIAMEMDASSFRIIRIPMK